MATRIKSIKNLRRKACRVTLVTADGKVIARLTLRARQAKKVRAKP